MNTDNLAGELRGLAARHDADHRARELLNDAALHIQNIEAQIMHLAQGKLSTESAKPRFDASLVSEQWLGDVIDFLHLVAGDLSHDNRLVALAARQLILNGPRVE